MIHASTDAIGRIFAGSGQIGRVYVGGDLVYSAATDPQTLKVSNGSVAYYNSASGSSSYGAWNEAAAAVPAGYTTLVLDSFELGNVYGISQHQILSGGTVLANVERVDHSTAAGTWTAGARYTVSPGQTVTYRVRAGVDTNRSTESGISGSCRIHFE